MSARGLQPALAAMVSAIACVAGIASAQGIYCSTGLEGQTTALLSYDNTGCINFWNASAKNSATITTNSTTGKEGAYGQQSQIILEAFSCNGLPDGNRVQADTDRDNGSVACAIGGSNPVNQSVSSVGTGYACNYQCACWYYGSYTVWWGPGNSLNSSTDTTVVNNPC